MSDKEFIARIYKEEKKTQIVRKMNNLPKGTMELNKEFLKEEIQMADK